MTQQDDIDDLRALLEQTPLGRLGLALIDQGVTGKWSDVASKMRAYGALNREPLEDKKDE